MKYGNSTYRAYYNVTIQPADVVPTAISLPSSKSVEKGKTMTLSPTITPSNAQTTLTWSSSNTSIATVSSSGAVTGVSVGTATITVKTSNNLSASCKVTVNPISPTNISLPASKTIAVDGTVTLTPTITPSNASTSLSWSSDDTSVATVTSSGVVRGIKEGTARIWVKTSNGLSDWCDVTVKPNPSNIEITPSIIIEVDNTFTLTPTIIPSNALYTLTWFSSNSNIATVSSSGVVRGIEKGTATITVKTNNGCLATCEVTVIREIDLADGQEYTNNIAEYFDFINYYRTFKNMNWQAWYVPFDLTLTSEVLDGFAFAEFAGTYTEEDGSFYITVVRLKEGDVVKANTPYCVQAKMADSTSPQVITQTDAMLKTAEENSFYVLSAEKKITFRGNYTRRAVTENDKNWYAMSGGQYSLQRPGNTIAPFRCFFTIEDREDNPYATTPTPAAVRLMMIDEETSIEELKNDEVSMKHERDLVYDLSGRIILKHRLPSGVYIINGKKVLVR